MKEKYAVILTDSISQAMRIEKELQIYRINSKMIPVPRHLSSDCGSCLRIRVEDLEKTKKIIDQKSLSHQSIEEL